MEDLMRKMAASFEAFNPSYRPERDSDQAPSRSETADRANSAPSASEFGGASGVAIAWMAFYAIAIAAGFLKAGVLG